MTNDILLDPTFDPSELYSPINNKFQEPTRSYDENIPFGVSRPLFAEVPFKFSAADEYIDNVITVAFGIGNWVEKTLNAAPFAVQSLSTRR